MRKACFLIFLFGFGVVWGQMVRLPEIDVYSEIGTNALYLVRNDITFSIDGGKKYGFRLDLLMMGVVTNVVSPGGGLFSLPFVDTISFQMEPFGLFEVEFFSGKWRTMAKKEYGYSGLKFFSDPMMSYKGAYDIRGVGVSVGKSFFDGKLYSHLVLCQLSGTNGVGMDIVVDSRIGDTSLEFSLGFAYVSSLYQAVVDNTLQKRYSILVRSSYSKLDFEVGIGFPYNALTSLPLFEDAYIHLAEHLLVGYFEQNLALFARPTMYNGQEEVLRQDVDFYLSLGARVLSYGVGMENTYLMSTNYQISDRVGIYMYSELSTVRFTLGFFYNVLDGIWQNPYGMYFSILGKI
jgi:hypothetical protein